MSNTAKIAGVGPETMAKLRYMVDQIAANFMVHGQEEAARATAHHIDRFWDPRMKKAIFADKREHLSPAGAAAIDQLVKASEAANAG